MRQGELRGIGRILPRGDAPHSGIGGQLGSERNPRRCLHLTLCHPFITQKEE